jgi:L-lysine exporter family protein LysE/ArgO
MTAAFLNGFILALGLILPLGVQNMFVFNQGARQPRFVNALPVVVTAALCDSLLILLAVLGVSVVVLAVYWLKLLLLGAGILFLLRLGWTTWNSKAQTGSDSASGFSPKRQIAFAASVSLLNPHAIMDTVGVIGTSSLRYAGTEKAVFAVSCIAVSWLWFAGLAVSGRIAGHLDRSGRFLLVLNKISAVIMWVTAVFLGYSLFE